MKSHLLASGESGMHEPVSRTYGDAPAAVLDLPKTPRSRFDFPHAHDSMGLGRPLERILVPTDFSPASTRALDQAVLLANEFDARLTILHVIDICTPSKPGESAATLMKRLWDDSFRRMAALAHSLIVRVDARTMFEEGLPWEEIAIKSRDADLVVLGETHRRSRWNFMSHRTVERVIQHAACPVLLVSDSTVGRLHRSCVKS
jgi:nucleotide-binding universal stress UspA family protein